MSQPHPDHTTLRAAGRRAGQPVAEPAEGALDIGEVGKHEHGGQETDGATAASGSPRGWAMAKAWTAASGGSAMTSAVVPVTGQPPPTGTAGAVVAAGLVSGTPNRKRNSARVAIPARVRKARS